MELHVPESTTAESKPIIISTDTADLDTDKTVISTAESKLIGRVTDTAADFDADNIVISTAESKPTTGRVTDPAGLGPDKNIISTADSKLIVVTDAADLDPNKTVISTAKSKLIGRVTDTADLEPKNTTEGVCPAVVHSAEPADKDQDQVLEKGAADLQVGSVLDHVYNPLWAAYLYGGVLAVIVGLWNRLLRCFVFTQPARRFKAERRLRGARGRRLSKACSSTTSVARCSRVLLALVLVVVVPSASAAGVLRVPKKTAADSIQTTLGAAVRSDDASVQDQETIAEKEKTAITFGRQLAEKNATIAALETEKETVGRQLATLETEKKTVGRQLAEKDAIIATLETEKETIAITLGRQLAAIATLEALVRGDLDLEDLQSSVGHLADGALSVAVLAGIGGRRRLTGSGVGCSDYSSQATAVVTDKAGLLSAVADASIECIDITSDITVTSEIDIAADREVRLTTSTGAALDGGGSTRIMMVNSGAVVHLEGLTFKNGYAVRTRPLCASLPTSHPTLSPSTRRPSPLAALLRMTVCTWPTLRGSLALGRPLTRRPLPPVSVCFA